MVICKVPDLTENVPMVKLVVPVSFPFGVQNYEAPLDFEFDSNLIRIGKKKTADSLKFRVTLQKDSAVIDKEINHGGIVIPASAANYFRVAHEKPQYLWQITIEIETDVEAQKYERDLKLLIPIFLQGVFNTFGYARVSPIIQEEDGTLLFNGHLANLTNPGQDWFALSGLLEFSTQRKFYDQMAAFSKEFSSEAGPYYSILHPYILAAAMPLDWVVIAAKSKTLVTEEVCSFGHILSEIVQQHPGIDYIPMVGLLTSFAEGLLKINGEHRYKFGIKLSNLFRDPALAPVAKKIYDSRSIFAHTGISKTPNDIFEFIRIEFLLLAIKKLLVHNLEEPITSDTFDFPSA